MRRDASTPLILWICAAICAHYIFAEGGGVIAEIHNDHAALGDLVEKFRDRLRGRDRPLEVTFADEPKVAESKDQPKALEKRDAQKPAEAQKAPSKKAVPLTAKPAAPAPPPAPDKPDHRIAVRQHAKPDQKDNPNANFIGDQANQVDQETVSTQTSHDRDDQKPSPGETHVGPQDDVGNSDKNHVGQHEDQAGEKNRGAGEHGREHEEQPVVKQSPRLAGRGVPRSAEAKPAAGGAEDANDGWTFNPIRTPGPTPGSGGAASTTAVKKDRPRTGALGWLGLGARPGPGEVNLNLTHEGVVAAVGRDELEKQREGDGERRRSEHRGSWASSGIDRWRSAIENYVTSVKIGNQTSLNTALSPFATYIADIHNRIHPIFAEGFLDSLGSLPSTHPLNDQRLITKLEIVLSPIGSIVQLGIVRTSGVTAFDVAALDSVQRASPFGVAPVAIISRDGNVYLHWEFHRDEVFACSTANARPYLLTTPPKPASPAPSPPNAPPHGEPSDNTPAVRHGMRVAPSTMSPKLIGQVE